MLYKVIEPSADYFGEPVFSQVKLSSRGLRGHDLNQFLKRASHEFVDFLKHAQFEPGEIPVHLLAIGSTEKYSSNRNGDGFREKICREFHPTFVKHARWFRSHLNKDNRKSYGTVKASAFNEAMSRIELLVLLNGNHQIAEKTGGLVADQEQEKLARGEDIPVSMACYVSHDVCSGCGNKARTRADYCDERKCVKYGGCRKNLGRTFEDGHTLHVDNPDPRFFDISAVVRPADRIAYTLYKAAHEQHLKSGAELAEEMGVTAPLGVLRDASNLPHTLISQLELLDQLTAVEKQASALHTPLDPLFFTTTYPVPSLRHYKLAHVLRALADVQAVMPLAQFLSLTAGGAVDATSLEKVASRVPGVFNRLANEPALENILEANNYLPGGEAPYREVRDWATKVAEDWSVAPERISHRLLRGAAAEASHRLRVAPIGEPQTLSEKRAEDLAREYALYQLGFLHAQRNHPQFAAISQLTLRGNQLTW